MKNIGILLDVNDLVYDRTSATNFNNEYYLYIAKHLYNLSVLTDSVIHISFSYDGYIFNDEISSDIKDIIEFSLIVQQNCQDKVKFYYIEGLDDNYNFDLQTNQIIDYDYTKHSLSLEQLFNNATDCIITSMNVNTIDFAITMHENLKTLNIPHINLCLIPDTGKVVIADKFMQIAQDCKNSIIHIIYSPNVVKLENCFKHLNEVIKAGKNIF